MGFWQDKELEYRKKMNDVYKEQVNDKNDKIKVTKKGKIKITKNGYFFDMQINS